MMNIKAPCSSIDCKGVGVFSCIGCRQTFCHKHSYEHHQELSKELQAISVQHDAIHQQLTATNPVHPVQKEIDEWEAKSLSTIKIVADEARTQVSTTLTENNREIMKDFALLTNELGVGWQTKNYVETDLNKWRNELSKTQQTINSARNMYLDSRDTSLPSINMIKIKFNNSDKFGEIKGSMQLEDHGRIVSHSGSYDSHSSVYGTKLYSNGLHRILIKIDKMHDNYWIFFGISSAIMPMKSDACLSRSAYGWAATSNRRKFVYLNGVLTNGTYAKYNEDIRKGDTIELTLDCHKKKIQLLNERTKQKYDIYVDGRECPFPWRLTTTLHHRGDRLSLI